LWNHAASERVSRYGLAAAVEGDLVYEDYARDAGDDLAADTAFLTAPAAPAADADATGAVNADAAVSDGEDADGASGACAPRRVRHVTAAEAADGVVPITAVLLPLPAASSMYPRNAAGDVFTRLAAADGVSLTGGQHAVREFSLGAFTGGYRRLMHRPAPGTLRWRLLRYDDPGADVTRTPLGDALTAEGRRPAPHASARLPPDDDDNDDARFDADAAAAAEAGDAAALKVDGEGRFLALQLCFRLPPSCYATMVRTGG
jgi:tRNA(Glu) U13 pseudouridine synthase TruD